MPENNVDTNKDPKNILGQLIGTGSNVFDQVKKEEGEKVLRKFLSSKAEEAVQQAGPEKLAESISFEQPEQQKQQQPQQPQVPDIPTLLGGLIRQHSATRGRTLDNVMKEQEITGTVPVQPLEAIKELRDAQKEGGLNANQIFTKFEPVANNFQAIVDSFGRVQASVEEPSAAGDLALIFNYMKILDPNSVVRESEFANAAATGALGERFIAVGKRLAEGKRLSPNMRRDFEDRAKKLFQSKERQFKYQKSEFERISEKQGIDPNTILRNVEFISGRELESPQEAFTQQDQEELDAINAKLGE